MLSVFFLIHSRSRPTLFINNCAQLAVPFFKMRGEQRRWYIVPVLLWKNRICAKSTLVTHVEYPNAVTWGITLWGMKLLWMKIGSDLSSLCIPDPIIRNKYLPSWQWIKLNVMSPSHQPVSSVRNGDILTRAILDAAITASLVYSLMASSSTLNALSNKYPTVMTASQSNFLQWSNSIFLDTERYGAGYSWDNMQ